MPAAERPSICQVWPLPYQADPGPRFAMIAGQPDAILLDSGQPVAKRGRFDLFSAWPLATFEPETDETGQQFLQRLRQSLRQLGPADSPPGLDLPFTGGLIGFLGYPFGQRLEPGLPGLARNGWLPDARLGLYGWALITDHQQLSSQLVFHPALADSERQRLIRLFSSPQGTRPAAPGFHLLTPFAADQTPETYQAAIERIQAYIRAGDCYQVNYTQRFRACYEGDSWQAFTLLRQACPTPFAGYLHTPAGTLLSLSPERFLRLHQGRVETRPIKGTRPRHADPETDLALADALRHSSKDRAENLMIVDLLRNDLGRCCQTGTVRVPELFALESYPNVHHLVSSVQGQLTEGLDALDLLAGSFPGGSITGAPKIRAMQIIRELEPASREMYCGSLLYLDVRGEMDSSIAIRTLLLHEGQISCWGGGGIVMDSMWPDEYQESITKVRILMQTLEQTLSGAGQACPPPES